MTKYMRAYRVELTVAVPTDMIPADLLATDMSRDGVPRAGVHYILPAGADDLIGLVGGLQDFYRGFAPIFSGFGIEPRHLGDWTYIAVPLDDHGRPIDAFPTAIEPGHGVKVATIDRDSGEIAYATEPLT